uniref:Polyprenal reductase n=1 Tax=Echinostoma caproni TaxID=27848 RepID=A0A183B6K6_9TREM
LYYFLSQTLYVMLILFMLVWTPNLNPKVPPHITILVSLAVFFLHVIRRFYETIYISCFGKNQMSITHFTVGELFYCAVPVALHCTRNEAGKQSDTYLHKPGIKPHYSEYESANGRYFVPVGSMFQHISCPHFLFEIALYLSFHWFLTARWTLFSHIVLFVFINQTCAAWITHNWYQEHFPEWAAIRSALVPHIF